MSPIPTNIPTFLARYQQTAWDCVGHKSLPNHLYLRLFWTFSDPDKWVFGAQGRNRTTDTRIFSPINEALSYCFYYTMLQNGAFHVAVIPKCCAQPQQAPPHRRRAERDARKHR